MKFLLGLTASVLLGHFTLYHTVLTINRVQISNQTMGRGGQWCHLTTVVVGVKENYSI
jgi:hypothetical protein